MSDGAPTIQIPRWIQLVGLPIAALIALLVVGKVFHAVFLFLVAGLIALLLDPLVRALERLKIPRGFSIAIVYLSFAAALAVVVLALGVIVIDQSQSAANRIDDYVTTESGQPPQTGVERDVDRLQLWLDTHHLERIDIRRQGQDFAENIKGKDVEKYTSEAIDFLRGAAISIFQLIFSVVLVLVVSIYMLLDIQRWSDAINKRFPPRHGDDPGLIGRMEQAIASYVRGQLLLSLIIGVTTGVGIYILGVVGAMPNGQQYAAAFGAWAGITELIPYIGPWLGAAPPVLYALVQDPLSALWVALLFLGIQQLEGHVVVPKVMGRTLRLHPLLVIFGLLAGGEIYGFPGILIALPLLAALRAAWEFFSERVTFQNWTPGGPEPLVEVGVEAASGDEPMPETPPAPAS